MIQLGNKMLLMWCLQLWLPVHVYLYVHCTKHDCVHCLGVALPEHNWSTASCHWDLSQLCWSHRLQLNFLVAIEVHSIAVTFPPARQHGHSRVFNQLTCHHAVVAYACNVCWHAWRRWQSTCIRVHVTCTKRCQSFMKKKSEMCLEKEWDWRGEWVRHPTGSNKVSQDQAKLLFLWELEVTKDHYNYTTQYVTIKENW